jgi:hypothetical protein
MRWNHELKPWESNSPDMISILIIDYHESQWSKLMISKEAYLKMATLIEVKIYVN